MIIKGNDSAKVINISCIITIHYFEFTSEYVYGGEAHDFWELVYVDKGELMVAADDKKHVLKQGELIFHKPNEFHSLSASKKLAPNIVIISFKTGSPAMDFFKDMTFEVPKEKSNYIANIINEAKGTYNSKLGALTTENKLPNPMFGSEQLMYCYLEMFLIDLYRFFNEQSQEWSIKETGIDAISPTQSKLINDIIEYMLANLDKNLQIRDITKEFFIGSTYLKVLFKQCTGCSVLSYFKKLKMREAKRLIRECRYNFSEISKMLGFSSVHYFSSSFKRHFGMNPSQYINMIKLKEEIMMSQSDF